jgi:hypothetical protein
VSRSVSRLRVAVERAADAIYRADPLRDHRSLEAIEAATALIEAIATEASQGLALVAGGKKSER